MSVVIPISQPEQALENELVAQLVGLGFAKAAVDLHGKARFGADISGLVPGMAGAWNWLVVLMVFLNSVTVLRASERGLFGRYSAGWWWESSWRRDCASCSRRRKNL